MDLHKSFKDLLDQPDKVLSNFFEVPVVAASPAVCFLIFHVCG